MAEIRREPQHHSGVNLGDILFALFKGKRTIMGCAAVGIIAAAAVYFLYPPSYESQAKLLVRYVLERRGVDPIDGANSAAANDTDKVIGAEIEILTSWDLGVQVAEAIGPQRLLPPARDLFSRLVQAIGLNRLLPRSGASATEGDAAGSVASGLKVINKGSNIILISYKNRNPEIATLVLQELLSRYFVKHLEVHRSVGAFDFVAQQTDQVRARLNQTEDALKSLREKTGIASLKEGSERLIRLRRNSPSKKPLLIRSVRARQRSGGQKASHLKKARDRKGFVLPVSKQRLRRLRPSFAMFSKGRSSFHSWLRRLKTWSGRRKWMLRITSTSQPRSRRRGSTRPWTRPKCPTSVRSNGLPLPAWRPKNAIRLPWDWLAAA